VTTDRDHLDAETVAAWMDGGLDAVSLAAAEAHASNCERCQHLLATVVKTEVAPGFSRGIPRLKAGATSASWWWRWWMAPIAATAAAVTLWMVVPQEQLMRQASAPTLETAARDEAAPPMAQTRQQAADKDQQFSEVKRRAEAAPPPAPPAREKLGAAANVAETARAKSAVDDRRDNKAEERVARLEAAPAEASASARATADRSAPRAEPARAPAAPAPAAAAPAERGAQQDTVAVTGTQLRKQFAPLVFVSPDPRFRWRATAEGIELSQDGGRTWLTVRLPQGEVVTAGASPAPLVCWIVGRRGLVLVATDGTDFTRIPFPEAVDLTAVSSPELRIAVVTTADGRTFRTENAGRSWRQQ
jgi:hypothetical protein